MAFPTTGILDSFDRADQDPIDSNWDPVGGWASQHKVASNLAAPQGTGACASHWAAGTFGPDMEVHVILTTAAATGAYQYLFVRLQDPTLSGHDGYVVRRTGAVTDTIIMSRVDNGAYTQLGATIDQEFADGDSLGLEVIGSAITAYRKTAGAWSSLGSRTDATYAGAGYLSFHTLSDAAARYNDLGGGTVVVGGGLSIPVAMQLRRGQGVS